MMLLYKILRHQKYYKKMGITLLQFAEIGKTITIVYAGLGIGIGIIGSSVSMKKYLEV